MSVTGENPFEEKKKTGRILVSSKEKRTEDDIVFASGWEKRVYVELRNAFVPGAFSLQPRIELQSKFVGPDGEKIRNIEYRGDFLFGPKRVKPTDPVTSEHMLIDAKGMEDSVYKMKKKMLLFKHGQPLYTPKRVKDLPILIALISKKYPNLVRY